MKEAISIDWHHEASLRIAWMKDVLAKSGTKGYVLGLSGGKDSAVVAALARQATENVLGVLLPCQSAHTDRDDALRLAEHFHIATMEINLEPAFLAARSSMHTELGALDPMAEANIKPRLRMLTLYAVAQTRGLLVAGTSNRSERAMGYFTKWGDSGCDISPIADLTVREVLLLGAALGVPDDLLLKPPSAGLWPGQTDEQEMGIRYDAIDEYLLHGQATEQDRTLIERAYNRSEHKRSGVLFYRQMDKLP